MNNISMKHFSNHIIGNQVNVYNGSLLRSTVSPWGENKRGEFLQLVPPPNPRQSRLHRDRLGDILRFHIQHTSIAQALELIQFKYTFIIHQ